ncbi:Hypothetical protein NTJ_00139 [Nesidiocoris tenuis]|uniref:Uncharacterized protein n=1 Tax=Nesidiocoris tenuis TaxID=355587 RepID=A0ABN7A7X4_9HEMI|nr:Hypothetical protein NTJ_00139 [Nesidiocoris tenuis]
MEGDFGFGPTVLGFPNLQQPKKPSVVVESESDSGEQQRTGSPIKSPSPKSTPSKSTGGSLHLNPETEENLESDEENGPTRKSSRRILIPAYLNNYDCTNMFAALSAISYSEEPETYDKAISFGNGWKEAVKVELKGLEEN